MDQCEYLDVEVIFLDGTKEMLYSAKRDFMREFTGCIEDRIFILKDGSERIIPYNVYRINYYVLDRDGHRRFTKPTMVTYADGSTVVYSGSLAVRFGQV